MKRNRNTGLLILIVLLSSFVIWSNVYYKFLMHIGGTPYNNSVSIIQSFIRKNNFTLKSPKLKYILMWTSPTDVPFLYLEEGQKRFLKNKCPYSNCFVTADRNYLEDYTQFDAVIFAGPELITEDGELPKKRSVNQKYVFASIESSQSYSLCSNRFDGYFNWTWTYRLDSESRWGYIVVRDMHNNVIGPKKVMHWKKLDDMSPVNEEFRVSLTTKTKAAAWFVSNCHSDSGRAYFINNLDVELSLFGLSVDIYGKCGKLICPKEEKEACDDMIKKTYYFYLAFENSFSEDYVTEKLLLGLRNRAIPIVYGAANYTMFMPKDIYLDARELGPKRLASKMNELIQNPHKYAEYFRWTNHYKYQSKSEHVDTDDYCGICKLMNDKKMMKNTSVYKNFRKWWDNPNYCLYYNQI